MGATARWGRTWSLRFIRHFRLGLGLSRQKPDFAGCKGRETLSLWSLVGSRLTSPFSGIRGSGLLQDLVVLVLCSSGRSGACNAPSFLPIPNAPQGKSPTRPTPNSRPSLESTKPQSRSRIPRKPWAPKVPSLLRRDLKKDSVSALGLTLGSAWKECFFVLGFGFRDVILQNSIVYLQLKNKYIRYHSLVLCSVLHFFSDPPDQWLWELWGLCEFAFFMRQAPRTLSCGTSKRGSNDGRGLAHGAWTNEGQKSEPPPKCQVASYLQVCRGILQSQVEKVCSTGLSTWTMLWVQRSTQSGDYGSGVVRWHPTCDKVTHSGSARFAARWFRRARQGDKEVAGRTQKCRQTKDGATRDRLRQTDTLEDSCATSEHPCQTRQH